MKLTHDKRLYVIEYEFEGRTIRHLVRNRCIQMKVENLNFSMPSYEIEPLLEAARTRQFIDVEEILQDGEEEKFDVIKFPHLSRYMVKNMHNITDINHFEKMVERGELENEEMKIRAFRFSHNPARVSVAGAGFRDPDVELAIMPPGIMPLLLMNNEDYQGAFLDDYDLDGDYPYLVISFRCCLDKLTAKVAENFRFYYIEPTGDVYDKKDEVRIDWKEFCKGVLDQYMEPSLRYRLLDNWDCDLETWSYPLAVDYSRTYPAGDKKLTTEDCLLNVPIVDIAKEIGPELVHRAGAGCVYGYIPSKTDSKTGRYPVMVKKYHMHSPEESYDPDMVETSYMCLGYVPEEYNEKIVNFTENAQAPVFIHLTTIILESQPSVVGEAFLLKCHTGHEIEMHNFTMDLYSTLRHKNDYSTKMYEEWKCANDL